MPTGQSNVDNYSLRFSSQVILACVNLTAKASHHTWQVFLPVEPFPLAPSAFLKTYIRMRQSDRLRSFKENCHGQQIHFA